MKNVDKINYIIEKELLNYSDEYNLIIEYNGKNHFEIFNIEIDKIKQRIEECYL